MNKYLWVLNIILVLAVFGSSLLFVPKFGLWYTSGAITAVIFSGVTLCIDFILTDESYRMEKWDKGHYFAKKYEVEIPFNALMAGLCYLFLLIYPLKFFAFLSGLFTILTIFVTVEWMWKILIFDKRKYKGDGC